MINAATVWFQSQELMHKIDRAFYLGRGHPVTIPRKPKKGFFGTDIWYSLDFFHLLLAMCIQIPSCWNPRRDCGVYSQYPAGSNPRAFSSHKRSFWFPAAENLDAVHSCGKSSCFSLGRQLQRWQKRAPQIQVYLLKIHIHVGGAL